jgi:hypothetical protein
VVNTNVARPRRAGTTAGAELIADAIAGLEFPPAAFAQLVDVHEHIRAACIRPDETEAFLPSTAF